MLDHDMRTVSRWTVHSLDHAQRPSLLSTERAVLAGPVGRHAEDGQWLRDRLREQYAQATAEGCHRRVRVVHLPLDHLMHAELTAVLLHAECGAPIRVVTATQMARWVNNLPPDQDVLTLGGEVTYHLGRGPDGAITYASRTEHPGMAWQWRHTIDQLYSQGEDAVAACPRLLREQPLTEQLPAIGSVPVPAPRHPQGHQAQGRTPDPGDRHVGHGVAEAARRR
ncbi:DUF6879 family protein [Kutzneria sp. 744]|uniref:DUF6879 family protein n=1 Tax=Kutzneria sp. (strain 744) TaxID=345341 RepID=UPI0012FCCA07|nr:DUF6879 family protein [Kutzneria sp. 744]